MAPGVVVLNREPIDTAAPKPEKSPTSQATEEVNEETQTNGKTSPPWAHYKTEPYKSPTAELVDRFIDEPRPLHVAVIGGGLAGILAGILLPQKVPGIKLTIYEKNGNFVSSGN
jgi:hypothetical protein